MRLALFALAILAAPARAQGVGDQLADLRLATAVRLALAADPATAPADARVRAISGAVAVDADWPSPDVEARAAMLAGGVAGVTSVAMGEEAPVPSAELGAGAAAEPDEAPSADEDSIGEDPPPADEPVIRPVTPEAPARVAADEPPPPAPMRAEPTTPAPAASYGHTVRIGDTLYSIARRYGTTVEELQRLNDLGDSTEITLGRRLRVRE